MPWDPFQSLVSNGRSREPSQRIGDLVTAHTSEKAGKRGICLEATGELSAATAQPQGAS
jgi:hypothetical protein